MTAATHPVHPEEIMALLDGELPAERAQAVSTHVEQCPLCSTVQKELAATGRKMSLWEVGALPAVVEERVGSAVATMPARTGSSGPSLFQRASLWTSKQWLAGLSLTAAAGLLLLAIATPTLHHPQMESYNAVTTRGTRAKEATKGASVDLADAITRSGAMEGIEEKQYTGHRTPFTAQLPLSQPQASEPRPASPMIARTVALSLFAKDFDSSRASLDAILARHNGYAAGLNVDTPKGAARTLQASLRIPAPQLAAALVELKALGRLEAETQNGEEVTQQHADLVARLKNSREAEERLQDVLRTRTGKVKEVLEVEEEITRVRGEIEQMEAEQKTLEHRVDFATIDVKITEEYQAQLSSPAPSVGTQLRNASINGFRSAAEGVLGIILFFAEAGPTFLLWLAILLLPARMLWRRYRRAHALGSPLGV
jgi:hypothetical protein